MTTATKPPLAHLALVGTPNSGKTSLFNALTGSRQKVANYPGVTVERKAGVLRHAVRAVRCRLVDLPGTYSLRGRSPDEEITRDIVLGRTPARRCPISCSASPMPPICALTIRLVLELKRTGRPLLLVLNMFDIARRRGVTVDVDAAVRRRSACPSSPRSRCARAAPQSCCAGPTS